MKRMEYEAGFGISSQTWHLHARVANARQQDYQTTGGATQSFILNSSKWDITKVETILP